MELTDLKFFIEVAESGSITLAAGRLHRVPSGVTTRIKLLEGELGVLLFERVGRRLVLSSDGTVFLDYAKRIILLSEQAVAAIGADVDKGCLRIGAMDSIAYRYSKQLSRYHNAYPDVSLSLVSGTAQELVEKVKDCELDLAIVLEAPIDRSLSSEVIARDRACVVSDLKHRAIQSQKDIEDSTILTFRSGCPYRHKLEQWLTEAMATPARIVEIQSYHAMIGCVVAGMGIAIIPESILDAYPKTAGFRVHALPRKVAEGELRIVYRGPVPNLKTEKLVAMLRTSRRQG